MKKLFLLLMSVPLMVYSQRDYSAMQVSHNEVAPGLYRLFVGNSVAVVAFNGPDGLLLIDAAYEQTIRQLRDTLNSLFKKPVRYLVNTHLHGDHTGGNVEFGKEADIISHHSVKAWLKSDRKLGDNNVGALFRNAVPNLTFEGTFYLDFNGQNIQMRHLGGGHTEGDIIIYFPESNVLVVGDLLFAGFFPFIDVSQGGNPLVFIENLQWITKSYPEDAVVIGGHGPVFAMDQVKEYLFNLQQTIKVISDARKKGMTADEMKQNHILKKWESYGTFFITEDRWIDIVFPFTAK
ncbi:MAG: MBL fold metallo-hydrolase [Sphingobacteriia bacterium]|nr:MBL fold metallo-hydrolase [Sphingobacteriia bacterium]